MIIILEILQCGIYSAASKKMNKELPCITNMVKFHLPLTLVMRLSMLGCSKNGDFNPSAVSGKVHIEWVMEHQV